MSMSEFMELFLVNRQDQRWSTLLVGRDRLDPGRRCLALSPSFPEGVLVSHNQHLSSQNIVPSRRNEHTEAGSCQEKFVPFRIFHGTSAVDTISHVAGQAGLKHRNSFLRFVFIWKIDWGPWPGANGSANPKNYPASFYEIAQFWKTWNRSFRLSVVSWRNQ